MRRGNPYEFSKVTAPAEFTGDGSTTAFTLPWRVGSKWSCEVYVGGVRQFTSYSISGTTLSFTSAPASGAAIYVIPLGMEYPVGTVADGSVGTAKLQDGAVTGAKLATGIVINRAYAEEVARRDTTTSIPEDDTIPQNTEGAQLMTCAITVSGATHRVRGRFVAPMVTGNNAMHVVFALFRNSDASAIQAGETLVSQANYKTSFTMAFEDVPGVGTHTYAVRFGNNGSTNNAIINGTTVGRLFGGAARATLVLEEIKA